jgi:hypothetical protein
VIGVAEVVKVAPPSEDTATGTEEDEDDGDGSHRTCAPESTDARTMVVPKRHRHPFEEPPDDENPDPESTTDVPPKEGPAEGSAENAAKKDIETPSVAGTYSTPLSARDTGVAPSPDAVPHTTAVPLTDVADTSSDPKRHRATPAPRSARVTEL